MIRPNCYPTYNERQQKIKEMIDWTLEKYKTTAKKYKTTANTQKITKQLIIDNIMEELYKKVAITKKQKTL